MTGRLNRTAKSGGALAGEGSNSVDARPAVETRLVPTFVPVGLALITGVTVFAKARVRTEIKQPNERGVVHFQIRRTDFKFKFIT